MTDWTEKEISISQIETLLSNDYEIEVDSPDGWVGVNHFINKGVWEEYVLNIDGFDSIRCNENHLFETSIGWHSAIELCGKDEVHILTKRGFRKGTVIRTYEQIPIVDINVNHNNHRYYTAGVSSHNTGVGKSLFMCHVAASCLNQGRNVLYITLELAEEEVAKRIDANLMNVTFEDLMRLPKDMYEKKAENLKSKTTGKLIIKEYPTAGASTIHFKALLNELSLKKSFKPDIIFIDYLNICMSARVKPGSNINSYTYIKSIAEELRGLAVEYSVPVVSATQTTRSGFCLDIHTTVKTRSGEKLLKDVKIGDELLSDEGYNIVKKIYPIEEKPRYLITTKSGKKIICSGEHRFPIGKEKVYKSIHSGLKIGEKLNIYLV